MKIIFFGTGKFGIASLEKLLGSSHKVVAVVTQPDRKKGRGWNVQPMPVRSYLLENNCDIETYQPENASDESFIEVLRGKADLFVVIDYGQFLSAELLKVPSKYCVNLHPSLLPKYRGAAPVNRAILEGETETGNTVFRMNERMDAGDIILTEKVKIEPKEDSLALSIRLSDSGSGLLLRALSIIEKGEEFFCPQNDGEATFARKLKKEMGEIKWEDTAENIERKIRAFNPWPGAYTYLDKKMLKLTDAIADTGSVLDSVPGTVLSLHPLEIAAAEGSITIRAVQLEGKKAMPVDEFLRGYSLEEGAILGEKG